MKTSILFVTCLFLLQLASAQLMNGVSAPKLSFTDLNGKSHSIQDYLDQGKTIYIDFFAAHCPYCWSYKNTGAMNGLYSQHGPNGTLSNDVVIIAIELDPNNSAYELSGNGNYTQGDWISALEYPIINPEGQTRTDVINAFRADFYPLIYAICPDGKIYRTGTLSTQGLNYFRETTCNGALADIEEHQVQNYWNLKENKLTFDAQVEQVEVFDLTGKLIEKNPLDNSYNVENNSTYFIKLFVNNQWIFNKFLLVQPE